MITILRTLYAVALFLWEQWRKDGEDVNKGGKRPLNFIVAILLLTIAIIVGYNYFYYRTAVVNVGQCTVQMKRGDTIWVHKAPVVVDYALVHRIVSLSMGTEILVKKLEDICAKDESACGSDTKLVLEQTLRESTEIEEILNQAFEESVVTVNPSSTTQQTKLAPPVK